MMYRAVNRNVDFWFKTSDCVVTEASKGLEWAIGKPVYTLLEWFAGKGIAWEVKEKLK